MKKLSSLSVFLPAYNEQHNIGKVIDDIYAFIPSIALTFEVIIVNDGSSDKTAKIVKKLQRSFPFLYLISHKKNKGYGAALKTGFKHSQYEWVFFTDSDNQFDIRELKDFIKFTKQYKAIIGYRKKRAEGGFRALNAYLFKLFVDMLFRLHVRDIDCAFKLLKRLEVSTLLLQSDGAFTTTEFLYLLKKKGVAFKQLPVTHYERKFGKPSGNSIRVVIKAFLEACKVFCLTHF